LHDEIADNRIMQIHDDKSLDEDDRTTKVKAIMTADRRHESLLQGVWIALIGVVVAISLAIAEPVVGRSGQQALVNASLAALLGLAGGVLVALFVNQLYNALGGGDSESHLGSQILARSVAWGVLGLFLAMAPGIVMRNVKKWGIGVAGGLVGGLIGGALFDPVSLLTHNAVVSRLVGIVTIGTLAGFATALIENAAKSGWLRVVRGLIAGKHFILYRNPTLIGSSPQCEIYLFKDVQVAPQHAAIHARPGGFYIEDLRSATGTLVNGQPVARGRLRNGDQIQIGSTAFTFQEKAGA
jgi:hypothetical protein